MDLIRNDILPKAQRTLDLSIDEYATDEVEYVRYRVAEANLQSQHGQLLASLARSVGQLEPIAAVNSGVVGQPEFEDVEPLDESPQESAEESTSDDDTDESNDLNL